MLSFRFWLTARSDRGHLGRKGGFPVISRRFSVYLILAVAVMAVAGFAAVAQGDISNYGGEVDYYSDATFSELVGYKIWNCQNPIVWGYRTEYWILDDYYFCGVAQGCTIGYDYEDDFLVCF